MDTSCRNKIFFLLLFACASEFTAACEHHLLQSRRGFLVGAATTLTALAPQISQAQANKFLFLDAANKESLVTIDSSIAIDPQCSMKVLQGSVYTGGYFFGLHSICQLAKKKLQVISSLQPSPGHFTIFYLGQNNHTFYNLINGRNFPSTKNGYLQVQIFNSQTHEVSEVPIVRDIPNFSGGLWWENGKVFVTVAEANLVGDPINEIFELDAQTLIRLSEQREIKSFSEVAQKVAGPFKGLSLRLLVGSNEFLYDNNEYGKYLISRITGAQKSLEIPRNCELIGPWKSQWLALCGAKLKLF